MLSHPPKMYHVRFTRICNRDLFPHIFAAYFTITWSAYFEKNVRVFLTCLITFLPIVYLILISVEFVQVCVNKSRADSGRTYISAFLWLSEALNLGQCVISRHESETVRDHSMNVNKQQVGVGWWVRKFPAENFRKFIPIFPEIC